MSFSTSTLRTYLMENFLSRYGQSEGTPSESGLKLDAQAALDFVVNHPELSKSPIVWLTFFFFPSETSSNPSSHRWSMAMRLEGPLPSTSQVETQTRYTNHTNFFILVFFKILFALLVFARYQPSSWKTHSVPSLT